ncbi:Bug family tripartite tricarboxylate transporter substrate binding protein [Nocardioides sp. B-3]|uniref:Bug family tripartite tricarboxylate transporter substrate binding protein n=1 Tax=Nocardioides sp. B-3 TaxID=2895565 RepID=UPI00300E1B5E
MRRMRPRRVTALIGSVALVLGLAGCGVTRGDDSSDILMIIPNSPGGGYDLTGRDAVQVLEDDDITGGSITVQNIVGAGGAVAMTELCRRGRQREHPDDGRARGGRLDLLLRQPVRPQRRHPHRPADERARGNPGARRLAVQDARRLPRRPGRQTPARSPSAVGRRRAAPDHLFPMQLAAEAGIDPNEVNYVTYDGGGPLTSALLGKKIDAGFSGLPEFRGSIESGELRVLAVSGEERYPRWQPLRGGAHADRVGCRPGLPQLARRAGAAGDQRRAHRRADRLLRGDARDPRVAAGRGGQRLDRRLQDR